MVQSRSLPTGHSSLPITHYHQLGKFGNNTCVYTDSRNQPVYSSIVHCSELFIRLVTLLKRMTIRELSPAALIYQKTCLTYTRFCIFSPNHNWEEEGGGWKNSGKKYHTWKTHGRSHIQKKKCDWKGILVRFFL